MEEYGMERIMQMKAFLEEVKEITTARRFKKIEEKLRENVRNVRNDLRGSMETLASGRTGGGITMSYLRSSYITNSHELYIAYYEEEPFVTEGPENICFSLKLLFEGIENDLQELYGKLNESFIRIFKGEKEEIRRWYMEGIYVKLGDAIRAMLPVVLVERGMDVYYGGYMDRQEMVGKI